MLFIFQGVLVLRRCWLEMDSSQTIKSPPVTAANMLSLRLAAVWILFIAHPMGAIDMCKLTR